MTDRPIAILRPTIRNVASGRCTRLRRVADGALGKLQVGDRLWLREAFYLNAIFDAVSPLTAASNHAWPRFERDLPPGPPPKGLGKHRGARLLPRIWHRAHLIVTAVGRQRLQDITDLEVVADGFASRAAWAEAWDRGVEWFSKGRAWAANPEVVMFDFRFVPDALPALPPKPAPGPGTRRRMRGCARPSPAVLRRQKSQQLDRPRPEPVELLDLPASTADRAWCDQCQRRVTPEAGRSCTSPFCDAAPAKLDGRIAG